MSETKLSAEGLYELLVSSQLSASHKLLVAAEQTIISALATADTKDVPGIDSLRQRSSLYLRLSPRPYSRMADPCDHDPR